MPLIQSGSEKAFEKNISTEIKAGKPVEQAAAIAYSTQRANDDSVEYCGDHLMSVPNTVQLYDIVEKSKTYGDSK